FRSAPSELHLTTAEAGPDDLIRLGHTQIRIRPPSYPVAPERILRAVAIYRRPAAFFAAALVAIGLVIWNMWILATDQNEKYMVWLSSLPLFVVIVLWISIWSLVSR